MPGGGGSQTTSTKPEFAEEVKPYITPLFEAAKGEFDKTFGKQYGGDFIAQPTGKTMEGLSLAEDVARNAIGAGGTTRSLAERFASDVAGNRFLNSVERFTPTAGGTALDAAISGSTANIKEQLLQDVLPALRSEAIQQGAYGGGMADQRNLKAIDDFTENALNIANQLAYQDFSDVRELNANAIAQRNALLPQLFGAEQAAAINASNLLDKGLQQDLFAGNVLREVSAGEQAVEQAAIDNLLAQFQQEQLGGFGQLQQLAGILGGFSPIGSSTTGPGKQGGGISGAIKGGLGGALAGAQIGSAGGPIGAGLGALLGAGAGFF